MFTYRDQSTIEIVDYYQGLIEKARSERRYDKISLLRDKCSSVISGKRDYSSEFIEYLIESINQKKWDSSTGQRIYAISIWKH